MKNIKNQYLPQILRKFLLCAIVIVTLSAITACGQRLELTPPADKVEDTNSY